MPATTKCVLEEKGGDRMNRKDAVIVALASLCLTVTLFSIIPAMSAPVYDTWKDVNDDGVIDAKDWQLIKIAIPSIGDPTKNVNVTNWPIKRTLNASLAYNLVIDGYPVYLEANVDGYSKMTLVMNVAYIEGSPTLGVNIRFIIGGLHTPKIYTNNTLPVPGTYFLLQSCEVIGPTIEIELDPGGGPMAVSLGIYATE
jgi:hypothetical protein